MEFTHRTVLRHAAVFAALVLLPFAMMHSRAAFLWYLYHAIFFSTLIFLAFALGTAAHLAVQRGIPADWISSTKREKIKDLPYVRRMVYMWASCSRCVGYWTAAGLVGVISLFFWPIENHSLWAVLLRTMYFAVMGGSLAGAVAVTLYIITDRSNQQT